MKPALTILLAACCLGGGALAQTQGSGSTATGTMTQSGTTQSGTDVQATPQRDSSGQSAAQTRDSGRRTTAHNRHNNTGSSRMAANDPNGCQGKDGRVDATGSGNGRSESKADAVDTGRSRSGASPCEDADMAPNKTRNRSASNAHNQTPPVR